MLSFDYKHKDEHYIMKIIILCGGKGTRLRGQTEYKPKPMVEVGNHPILWHIMKTYSHYGFNEFILCLGYKSEVIKQYFLNYRWLNSSFTIDIGNGEITPIEDRPQEPWRVTLADTGQETMTGARVKKVESLVEDDLFMLTYGDGVCNVDINQLLQFHQAHGKIGTVTAVAPVSRYGELAIDGDQVTSFQEKPKEQKPSINGGYFVFKRDFFDYLSDDPDCILERSPLEKLTEDGELKVYQHKGFWQCMDTPRDHQYLNELWSTNQADWRVWDE